ncbi:conjugal transfer protein TraF [Aliivibrio logei]|uniref:Conjugal transfer protein TraF n=1 Tax=Aliivibrio logei TaxID=688 RepID=A0A1B9NTV1_ALILO|nr:conjugal transfer protein TraF [Aliivibrio logei]OCH17107.1 conjugal transfer protein TraF [Aliivibrio logei]
MKQWIKIGLLSSTALVSSQVQATNFSVDGRIDAMGGAGTASADYLTGVFYNPALVAIYSRKDDAGLLLPSIGLQVVDKDNMIDDLDNLVKAYDKLDTVGASQALADLSGDAAQIQMGTAIAFAIPNRYLSMNFFAKATLESVSIADVEKQNYGSSIDPAMANVFDISYATVDAAAIGVAEFGVAFSGYTNFLGQNFTVGISPKIQKTYTFNYSASAVDFEFKDMKDNYESGDTSLNFDVGTVWFNGPWRFALAGKNLISQEIQTKETSITVGLTDADIGRLSGDTSYTGGPGKQTRLRQYTYKMEPIYTAGIAFMTNYFVLTADVDLNEQERFVELDDNMQMLRVGAEFDLLYQIQLRGGFKKDLAGTYDDALTAGIGFSPLNMFHLDLAAIYSKDSTYGVSVNMAYEY